MMTDPVADMLTRLRNASRIGRKSVSMPASKLRVEIANVLKDEGYIDAFAVEPGKPSSVLTLQLRYGPDGERAIRTIERISKPGCRIYMGVKELPHVLRGMGVLVLSTPAGVVSDRRARTLNVGGEVLAKIF